MSLQTNPLAPGFKTTEFYTTIASVIGVVLLALGITDHQTNDALVNLISQALSGVAAIVTIGWIVVEYIKGRRSLKGLLITKGLIPTETPAADLGAGEPSA